ncbi:MAG: class II fructose-bisphosphate aldolase, partial [Clostridia bacterium]
AAEELCSPVIVQTTGGTLKYAPPEVFCGMVSQLAQAASVPVVLHLDHGSSFAMAQRAVEAGYTSVMIDGSTLPYEENVALTKSVVEMAKGIPVEGELGTVGGKEDDHAAGIQYTDPVQAKDFVERTGLSSLAPAIGTAHGVYKDEPKLDVLRLSEIRDALS